MKKNIDSIIFLALVGITALSANAQAGMIVFEEGDSGYVQNVLFNDSSKSGISSTVDGFHNPIRRIVGFTGTAALGTPSGGQAGIEAANEGTYNLISFEFEDPALGFDKVQFNIDAVENDRLDLTFKDQLGNGVVPEPPTMVLLGAGMAGLGFFQTKRRRI